MLVLRFVFVAMTLILLQGCQNTPVNAINDDKRRLAIADARIDLGIGYLQGQHYSKALQNLQLAHQQAKNYYRVYLSLAQAHSLLQQYSQAENYYLQAIKLAPDNEAVLFHYALHLCYQASYAAALPWYNKAMEKAQQLNRADILYTKALCALYYHSKQQAVKDLTQAIIYQPDHLNSVYKLAQLEFQTHRYQQAKQRLLDFHHQFAGNKMTYELLLNIERAAADNASLSLGSDSWLSSGAAHDP